MIYFYRFHFLQRLYTYNWVNCVLFYNFQIPLFLSPTQICEHHFSSLWFDLTAELNQGLPILKRRSNHYYAVSGEMRTCYRPVDNFFSFSTAAKPAKVERHCLNIWQAVVNFFLWKQTVVFDFSIAFFNFFSCCFTVYEFWSICLHLAAELTDRNAAKLAYVLITSLENGGKAIDLFGCDLTIVQQSDYIEKQLLLQLMKASIRLCSKIWNRKPQGQIWRRWLLNSYNTPQFHYLSFYWPALFIHGRHLNFLLLHILNCSPWKMR